MPCVTRDGAPEDIVGTTRLSRVLTQERTECSDPGAQSTSPSPRRRAVHCGQQGLRLDARITLQASIASFGQNYQVLDRGYQPRAMGTPVQFVLAASMHTIVPRLADDRGAPSGCQRLYVTP